MGAGVTLDAECERSETWFPSTSPAVSSVQLRNFFGREIGRPSCRLLDRFVMVISGLPLFLWARFLVVAQRRKCATGLCGFCRYSGLAWAQSWNSDYINATSLVVYGIYQTPVNDKDQVFFTIIAEDLGMISVRAIVRCLFSYLCVSAKTGRASPRRCQELRECDVYRQRTIAATHVQASTSISHPQKPTSPLPVSFPSRTRLQIP